MELCVRLDNNKFMSEEIKRKDYPFWTPWTGPMKQQLQVKMSEDGEAEKEESGEEA